MADTKISALTELSATDLDTAADFFPIVDTSAGITKKILPRSVTQRRVVITPDDYGAVGDGSTDDSSAFNSWIAVLIASPVSYEGLILSKTYAIASSLSNITASGVIIRGFIGGNRDVGSSTGSVIKAIAGCTGTMLTVAPTEGASAQALNGNVLAGVTFDCNSIAAKGIIFKAVRHSDIDIYVQNATTDGCTFDVATTLGEACDSQMNRIWYRGRQVESASGVSLRLKGSASANTSFNDFYEVDILHKDALGIIEENADNNTWHNVRVFQAAGGSATNSIEWRGGSSASVACRAEVFLNLSTTVGAIAKGTGTYTVGANNINIHNLDVDNSTPYPTEETGTSVWVNQQRKGTWTPSITFATPGNLAVTYSTQIGRYVRVGRLVTVEFFITTSGFTHTTASGNLSIATLPFAASTVASFAWFGTLSWQGITKATYTYVQPGVGSAGSDIQFAASGSGVSRSSVTAADMPTGGTVILAGVLTYETDAAR